MAALVLVALEGKAYAPPACAFRPWIEELARRGVVSAGFGLVLYGP
jgi:hypothetical protein